MKKHVLSFFAVIFLALGFSFSSAQAQSGGYSQEDLDAILAPIALYPDELLTQVLIASTYPDDVADARAYLDRYPSLQQSSALLGNQVASMPWDDSVKSLSQFPSVLAMLDDQPEWEDALGYAFLNQQDDVMQTVQRLRARAERAGYLKTNSQQIVDVQRNIIVIMPSRDNFYYVPYYDPQIVYGRWWWPNTQPYYWEPTPRYRPANYALVNGFFFGVSVGIINSIFHPVRPDWRHRHVIIIGGTKPGSHWQWKPRPPRPGMPNRPGKPNRPPTVKPPMKPRPPRPVPPKPGRPEIQPPKPGIPGRPQPPRPGRPEIQPPKPGNPGIPGRPGKPEVQPPRPTPGRPGILPVRPKPPETKPVTPPVTRPMPTRPVVTPPAVKPVQPVTRPAPEQRPATRPAPNKPDREKPDDKDDRRDRRTPG